MVVSAIVTAERGEGEKTAEAEWDEMEALVTNLGVEVVIVEVLAVMGTVEGVRVMDWVTMVPVRAAAGCLGEGMGLAAATLSLLHR